MHDLKKLYIISLSGKVLTLILFALLARSLAPSHLAYIALIPALAPVLLSLFGFGINTFLERDVPQALSRDMEHGYRLMRTGYVLNLFIVMTMLVIGSLLVGYWAPVILGKYDYNIVSITWILAPVAGCMLLQVTGLFLLLEGRSAKFGVLRIYSDIVAKTAILIIYLIEPSELAVIIGFAIGQVPFLLYGIWLQRGWLFKKGLVPVANLFRCSVPFYIESNFNAARNQGDSLLVSSLLGPTAMASYYVAKTVAGQLSVFFNPINSFMVHRLSFQKGKGKEAMEEAFKQVWHLSVPIFTWLACAVAAVSPLLIKIVAGEQYSGVWPTAVMLCLVVCCLALYALSSRVLLIIGSAYERFRITILQTILIVLLTIILVPSFGAAGIALSWLLAVLVSIYVVRIRTSHLAFCWPILGLSIMPKLLTLLMPALTLYLFSLGINNMAILVVFSITAICSLWAIFYYQDNYEEAQMRLILPRKVMPLYLWMRKKTV